MARWICGRVSPESSNLRAALRRRIERLKEPAPAMIAEREVHPRPVMRLCEHIRCSIVGDMRGLAVFHGKAPQQAGIFGQRYGHGEKLCGDSAKLSTVPAVADYFDLPFRVNIRSPEPMAVQPELPF